MDGTGESIEKEGRLDEEEREERRPSALARRLDGESGIFARWRVALRRHVMRWLGTDREGRLQRTRRTWYGPWAALSAIVVFGGAGCPSPCDSVSPALNAWRDEVLATYFTEEAIAVIGNVPMRYCHLGGGWSMAVGDDWGSRLASVAAGCGNCRQVVLSEWADDYTVVHEYVHQADYAELISRDLFEERYGQVRGDPLYADIALALEDWLLEEYASDLNGVLSLVYDDGFMREIVAYLIQGWLMGYYDLPPYMLEVYGGVIRGTSPQSGDSAR
jgi:hypothetical protein